MRLRQSIAKLLIRKCPAIAQAAVEGDFDAESNLMRKGSLLDQLVFEQANYHVVEARLKSGPRKGELASDWKGTEARAIRAEMRAKGVTACFQHELDEARSLAGLVRARLLEAGAELRDDSCPRQLTLQWRTELGVEAEGTPDLIILHGGTVAPTRVDTVDLKRTDPNPEWLDRHVDDQCWDLQAVAYQEAAQARWPSAQWRGRHWILAADAQSRIVQMYPLDGSYIAIGRSKWHRAQEIWLKCIATGEWPEYASRPLTPPEYVRRRELGM